MLFRIVDKLTLASGDSGHACVLTLHGYMYVAVINWESELIMNLVAV